MLLSSPLRILAAEIYSLPDAEIHRFPVAKSSPSNIKVKASICNNISSLCPTHKHA